MQKVENVELDDGYELEIFKLDSDSSEVSKEDSYRFMGWINKSGEMLEDFEGSGNFATAECVVSYLMEYLLEIEDVAITKDNIHLYYEYMSDGDLKKLGGFLSFIFNPREIVIKNSLVKIKDSDFFFFESHIFNGKTLSQAFFGIKDTLKPIDEYIAEIKESDAYKEYIHSSIDDYQNRLTDAQKDIVLEHCEEYGIKPVICAWYDDKDDFDSDWVEDLNYSQEDADDLLANKEEFITFADDQIIRFSM